MKVGNHICKLLRQSAIEAREDVPISGVTSRSNQLWRERLLSLSAQAINTCRLIGCELSGFAFSLREAFPVVSEQIFLSGIH